jgi:hypothetical protein
MTMASTQFPKASERPSSSGLTTLPRLSPNSRQGVAPALGSPHEWLGRLLIAWIADPDGNPIQIVQRL